MKKKFKKLIKWFYLETDRGEENISNCSSLYELVEKLQYRVEDLENEHMLLLREMQKIYNVMGQKESNYES